MPRGRRPSIAALTRLGARKVHHQRIPSRGFLHWRFADAGPAVRGTTFMGPPSENLHNKRLITPATASPNRPPHKRARAIWGFNWSALLWKINGLAHKECRSNN